jgi:hypothetical protein
MAQPGIITSVPALADIPAVASGLHTLTLAGTGSQFNSTRTIVVSANNETTILIAASNTVQLTASPASSTRKYYHVRAWSITVGLTNLVGESRFLTFSTPLSTTGTSPLSASSTSTTAPNNPVTGGGGSNTNIGAIAGGVVGGIAVIGMVVIALYWIRRRHPKQKVAEAHVEEPKSRDVGYGANSATLAELDSGPMQPTPELDARWNQINELPAGKK